MTFVKDLIGGMVIMGLATVVGITQNAVRSDGIKLFPRVAKPAAPTASAYNNATEGVGEQEPAGEIILATSPTVTPEELAAGELSKERVKIVMEAGTAIIIDARGEAAYAEGHIPSALNIPYDRFTDYYADLETHVPLDATVIVYCTSLTCDLSENLAQELRLMEYANVVLYRGGWDEWSEAGYPTETGVPEE